QAGGDEAVRQLFDLARTDLEPRVQAQAIRALGDVTDPMLLRHRLDAGPGDAELAARLAAPASGEGPRVVREIVSVLSRLAWPDAPGWLRKALTQPDAALVHAAMQALRRSGNWPAVLKLLDEPAGGQMRGLALRALAERFETVVVDGLIDRLRAER